MAVNFTPNLGLAKPTEDEMAQNWVSIQKLAEDNNIIVGTKSDFPMQNYTPTIIGPTTNPSIGAGETRGYYTEFQGWIFGSFVIVFNDPGISVGSGTGGYGIRLPTLADIIFYHPGSALNDGPASPSCIGEGYYLDFSNILINTTCALDLIRIGGVDYVRMLTETYTGKTVGWVGPNIPTALADGDSLSGSFVYKRG